MTALRCILLAGLLAWGLPTISQADDILATLDLPHLNGEQIYTHLCQACHMPDGQGAIGAGRYPKLAADPALASWRFVALTVMEGRNGMPPFGLPPMRAAQFLSPSLSDAQIAEIVNYVRSHFGNRYRDKVNAGQVAALRRQPARAQ